MVAELRHKAAELAKRGIKIDAEEIIRVGEKEHDEDKGDLIIDPQRIDAILSYANAYWRKYPNLPKGWSSDWPKWENLFTFFYPANQYFIVIPQIEFMINIRYGIPGDIRPLMFNNETEAFVFEVVERRFNERGEYEPVEMRSEEEVERTLYYVDWQEEEVYTVKNASTMKELTKMMVRKGGSLDALELSLLESDEEGEEMADRVLDSDASVLPLLEKKYLGYMPPPSIELSDRYEEEAEQMVEELGLGSMEDEFDDIDPEVAKEGEAAYRQLMQLANSMQSAPEEMEMTTGLLELMRDASPEELKPLSDLFTLLKSAKPEQIPIVAEELRKHYLELEREVQGDAQVLGQVLHELKKDRASVHGDL
ncbi:hypothetical protein BKA70DRAFT_1253241 [Coprinopsis sp. MPI-PUGE-AT-0042]|nr:hypothetical protein BKA70DRAFT_1253241 [Coprinopsis sp. MPI-PUGE-AT-0042]